MKKNIILICSVILYLIIYIYLISNNDFFKSIFGFHFLWYYSEINFEVIFLYIFKSTNLIFVIYYLLMALVNFNEKCKYLNRLYLLTLFYLLITKGLHPEFYFNIDYSIIKYASLSIDLNFTIDDLLNIILFIPLPIVFRSYLLGMKYWLIIFVFSPVIEIIQLLFNIGIFDIMDIIYNTLGVLLGLIILKLNNVFAAK